MAQAAAFVTAVPAEHHHFVSWSDGMSTPNRTDLNVMADLVVTASFAINQYNLSYNADKHGSIDGVKLQKVNHDGTGKMVMAKPAVGYHFVGWSDGLTTAKRTDTDVKADLAVSANFALNQYTLNYAAGKNGTIEGASQQTVNHGGDGSSVTAVPAEYYHFVSWSDGVAVASRTDRKVTAGLAVKANFAIDKYTLTYSAEAGGSIDGNSSQKVHHGGTGTMITAKPAEGYRFVSWSDGLLTAKRTETDVKADFAVTAGFALIQYRGQCPGRGR